MNRLLYCCLLSLAGTTPVMAKEKDVSFTATPEQCVALHKGQTCYQDIVFQWKTPADGKFCLLQSETGKQVICWQGRLMQQYQYSFNKDKTTKFRLIDQTTAQPLAEVKVVVTWVYKAPKQSQSGWRLF
ncbi:DUF3019 domain-containing protein [Vibrio halioticoli]|uniref:DUF3019 domain-containing protein n=1 Tax=Vibrio halioticoli NBRC 102217 TaxID=1219072 RepID=V5FCS1_9VIBR|nr:DUF3019 domain-containing protein [Vibrio halioticoli]GAD89298.1 hypothetical protein VHA01S_018_00860 [Vibrio halioticoli NBRC 102217]